MNLSTASPPALVLIDVQQGFDDIAYWGGQRNNPEAEKNIQQLLAQWRRLHLPVLHVKHCSTNPASPLHAAHTGNAFMEFALPVTGEGVISKNVNSAFIGTGLEEKLVNTGISKLVLAGFTTDHCVSTTARMAGNLGFETFIVADATATFCKKGIGGQYFPAELIHQTALASLQGEFATVVNTALVSQLLKKQ